MNKTIITLLLATIIIGTGTTTTTTIPTNASTTSEDPIVFAVDDLSVKTLSLKAIQSPNGQTSTNDNFEIQPQNVVQLRQPETSKV